MSCGQLSYELTGDRVVTCIGDQEWEYQAAPNCILSPGLNINLYNFLTTPSCSVNVDWNPAKDNYFADTNHFTDSNHRSLTLF